METKKAFVKEYLCEISTARDKLMAVMGEFQNHRSKPQWVERECPAKPYVPYGIKRYRDREKHKLNNRNGQQNFTKCEIYTSFMIG